MPDALHWSVHVIANIFVLFEDQIFGHLSGKVLSQTEANKKLSIQIRKFIVLMDAACFI